MLVGRVPARNGTRPTRRSPRRDERATLAAEEVDRVVPSARTNRLLLPWRPAGVSLWERWCCRRGFRSSIDALRWRLRPARSVSTVRHRRRTLAAWAGDSPRFEGRHERLGAGSVRHRVVDRGRVGLADALAQHMFGPPDSIPVPDIESWEWVREPSRRNIVGGRERIRAASGPR
jgi:hypothetical protein